ncbi:MAG: SMC-Scp complex subunit ScpB [Acidimicrobiales bacterium]
MATEARRAVEAILMVADSPIEPSLLAQLLEISPGRVEELCEELTASYRDEDRGFVLMRVAGGYRFQSHPDLAPYVERFALEGQSARLSGAALETLAIVAYKQPVSRAQVAAIRGVNAEGVMRTLQQRGIIAEVGHDPGPGQALLYGTTPLLLERLGLDRIEDLPPLVDFVPGAEVMEALDHRWRAGPESAGPESAGPESGESGDGAPGDGEPGAAGAE